MVSGWLGFSGAQYAAPDARRQVSGNPQVASPRRAGYLYLLFYANPASIREMALRTFTDSTGTEWKVWDVIPAFVREQEERGAGESDSEHKGPERRRGVDRSNLLTPGLEQGWLCFEAESEKRRLTPIPPEWDQGTDEDLAALCSRATARPQVT